MHQHTVVSVISNIIIFDVAIVSMSILFQLGALRVTGVSETYGRSGHRVGAVESPLTFFTNEGTCVAKV